jgi:hypothetical protein
MLMVHAKLVLQDISYITTFVSHIAQDAFNIREKIVLNVQETLVLLMVNVSQLNQWE